jgi:hypothetical protein
VRSEEIDLRLSIAGEMDMSWLMVERVDDKSKTVRPMNDDHRYK